MEQPTREQLIEWVDALCTEAQTAAEGGNAGKLNLMGTNPVLSYYLNNVHFQPNVSRMSFFSHAPFAEEVKRLYAIDQNEKEVARKLAESAAENAALKDQVASLQEQMAKALAAIEALNAKPAKASKKAAKVEEAEQTDEETPAESE